jgi:hypothetical protein
MCNGNGKVLSKLTFSHAKISPGHKDKLTFLATPCEALELADLLHISTLRCCVASVGFLIVVRLLTRTPSVPCCRRASKQPYRLSLANVVASQARDNCSAYGNGSSRRRPTVLHVRHIWVASARQRGHSGPDAALSPPLASRKQDRLLEEIAASRLERSRCGVDRCRRCSRAKPRVDDWAHGVGTKKNYSYRLSAKRHPKQRVGVGSRPPRHRTAQILDWMPAVGGVVASSKVVAK